MEESCRLQNLLPTPSCGIKNREATSTSLLWSNYLGSLHSTRSIFYANRKMIYLSLLDITEGLLCRLSIKVYFQHRRVCIREALPLEGVRWVFWSRAKENSDEGVFSPHFAAKSIIRSAHTPHPSATPPPSPHVGKAKRNLENFLFAYTF